MFTERTIVKNVFFCVREFHIKSSVLSLNSALYIEKDFYLAI